MTLLITIFAAVITTIVWYVKVDDNMKLGTLCLMYWGASLMWFVDAVVGYIESGAEYFTPALSEMVNDSFLGFSVVALGLVIWLIVLFIKDPKKSIHRKLNSVNVKKMN